MMIRSLLLINILKKIIKYGNLIKIICIIIVILSSILVSHALPRHKETKQKEQLRQILPTKNENINELNLKLLFENDKLRQDLYECNKKTAPRKIKKIGNTLDKSRHTPISVVILVGIVSFFLGIVSAFLIKAKIL